MIYYLKLIRPLNCIITFLTVIVAAFIASDNSFPYTLVISGASAAFLVTAAGNVINDFFDIEIDKVAHPNRPLVVGKIKKDEALRFYIILNSVAILISYFNGLALLGIVAFSAVLLLLYSFTLKRIILFGNFTVAFLTGMVFLFGGVLVGNVYAAIIPAIFAFLINFIREIVKDIHDIKGDLNAGVLTFPSRFGIDRTKLIILILSIILIILTIHPFILGYYKIEYFLVIMIVVNPVLVYFLKSIYLNHTQENINRMSGVLKLNMLVGLIAIYVGK